MYVYIYIYIVVLDWVDAQNGEAETHSLMMCVPLKPFIAQGERPPGVKRFRGAVDGQLSCRVPARRRCNGTGSPLPSRLWRCCWA